MSENTKIQWSDHTWNPWFGCTRVSTGCEKCYAEVIVNRHPTTFGHWGVDGTRPVCKDWNKPRVWDRKASRLGIRYRVFPSMCDIFEDRDDLVEPRNRFFDLVAETPNLDWLVLTKRPEKWRKYWTPEDWRNLPNLWMGVSVENQEYCNRRIPELFNIPAKIHWVSYEPALGPVDFTKYLDRIDWIVCGGESGRGARPFQIDWARSTRDQCKESGTAFYMKQLGAFAYDMNWRLATDDPKGGNPEEWHQDINVREFPMSGTIRRQEGR